VCWSVNERKPVLGVLSRHYSPLSFFFGENRSQENFEMKQPILQTEIAQLGREGIESRVCLFTDLGIFTPHDAVQVRVVHLRATFVVIIMQLV